MFRTGLALLAVLVTTAAYAEDKDTFRVLVFGDSHVQGNHLERSERIGHRLGDILGKHKKPTRVKVIAKGYSAMAMNVEKEPARNALKTLPDVLKKAGKVDEVVLMFGSNDVKRSNFAETGPDGVAENLRKLIKAVRKHYGDKAPAITYVGPAPVGKNLADWAKEGGMYVDANDRIRKALPELKRVCIEEEVRFVNSWELLKDDIEKKIHDDGIHLTAEGYGRIVRELIRAMQDHTAPHAPKLVRVQGSKVTFTPYKEKDIIGHQLMNGDQVVGVTLENEWRVPKGKKVDGVRSVDAAGNRGKITRAGKIGLPDLRL
ncbi:MAG: SGNH/GDSL hydrolase family protein [Phycisphaerae bacterium]